MNDSTRMDRAARQAAVHAHDAFGKGNMRLYRKWLAVFSGALVLAIALSQQGM